MRITNNALNVLAAKTYRGIGRAWIVRNIEGNESADRLVTLLSEGSKEGRTISVHEFEERKQYIRNQLEQFEGVVDGVVAIGDSSFPMHRGIVKNSEKPVVLFYRGDLRLLEKENKNVAVIGLLNPDEEIELVEKQVVSSLVSYGATIVSGLALGCDTVAHKQALLSGGKTVAILPSPISDILPQKNKVLAEEIVQRGGLLVSEYYERAKSKIELRGRYQERDRLQAMFSDCVVLSASYAKNDLGNDSGSRLAMEYAKKYSIPRAVIYDQKTDAKNPKYDLNRQLIKEDREITIINRQNLASAIKRIISASAAAKPDQNYRRGLFDFV